MSWVAPVANWASILLYKKDLMTHLGKSYTLETIHFRGTPPMITALANNELEISNLAYSTLAIAIANAGMDDIRVIADEFQDGVPGYFSEQYYVRKDCGIAKVEDLKGKVVGTNAAGSAVDIASRAMLRKHGLEPKRDYTIVEGPLPAMPAMLLEKKADLIPAVLPFALNPKLRADGKVLFTSGPGAGQHANDRVDGAQAVHRRAPCRNWSTSWRTCCGWCTGISDPKNHDAAAEIASKLTKAPASRFGWLFTKQDTYRDPNLLPDLDALQRNVDTVQDLASSRSTSTSRHTPTSA